MSIIPEKTADSLITYLKLKLLPVSSNGVYIYELGSIFIIYDILLLLKNRTSITNSELFTSLTLDLIKRIFFVKLVIDSINNFPCLFLKVCSLVLVVSKLILPIGGYKTLFGC